MKTYLPNPPFEVIEIDMESLTVDAPDEQGGDPFEEFQMRAELAAVRLNIKRKQQRNRSYFGRDY